MSFDLWRPLLGSQCLGEVEQHQDMGTCTQIIKFYWGLESWSKLLDKEWLNYCLMIKHFIVPFSLHCSHSFPLLYPSLLCHHLSIIPITNLLLYKTQFFFYRHLLHCCLIIHIHTFCCLLPHCHCCYCLITSLNRAFLLLYRTVQIIPGRHISMSVYYERSFYH